MDVLEYFKYANLDGSNEKTGSVTKEDGTELLFFSLTTNKEVIIPIDYDLIFARYTVPLDAGDGTFIDYTVGGILLAPNTSAVVANNVDVTTVDGLDYVDQLTSSIATIGHEWRIFDFEQGWLMQEDRAQFVLTSNYDLYKIVFLDFEGSSTGIATLEKTFITQLSATETFDQVNQFVVFPNPTTDYLTIKGDDQAINLTVIDNAGRTIKTLNANTNEAIDFTDLNSGSYFVLVRTNEGLSVQSIIKK